MKHLSQPSAAHLVPELAERTSRMGSDMVRLLRLVCSLCFDSTSYFYRKRIGTGQFGTVYSCQPEHSTREVIVKLVDNAQKVHDRCVLREIFGEIAALEKVTYLNPLSVQITHIVCSSTRLLCMWLSSNLHTVLYYYGYDYIL